MTTTQRKNFKRRRIYPKLDFEIVEMPVEFGELADRRTAGFVHGLAYTANYDLRFLLRSAYLQGCADMAQALKKL